MPRIRLILIFCGAVVAACMKETPRLEPLPPDHPIVSADGTMVFVPEGEFWMGCGAGMRPFGMTPPHCPGGNEEPAHKVYLDAYWIDAEPATVLSYGACVDAGNCTEPVLDEPEESAKVCNWRQKDRSDLPVNCITWNQASSYCQWATKRLPTEAEWEKASRGTDGRAFPWGDADPECPLDQPFFAGKRIHCRSNKPANDSPCPCSLRLTPTPYGARGMIFGELFEWVSDWYNPYYYFNSPWKNPTGPREGIQGFGLGLVAAAISKFEPNRTLRNGAFTTTRFAGASSTARTGITGLRCAKSAQ